VEVIGSPDLFGLNPFSKPNLHNRLSGDANALRFLIQAVDHPSREVDINAGDEVARNVTRQERNGA